MDIGGGSVEFISFKEDDVAFTGSFKIGVAVLYSMFHHSDPIAAYEIEALEEYLEHELRPLIHYIKKVNEYYLIGASGSFEVIHDVLPKKESSTHWAEIEISGIIDYMNGVIDASLEQRKKMPEIPEERLDYIVVAYLLIRFVIRTMQPSKLYYCDYALKEGVVADMIQNDF